MQSTQVPSRFRAVFDEEVAHFGRQRVIEQRKAIPDTTDIPLLDPLKWLRIPDVICVYADMKDSTRLSASTQDKATAGVYRLFTSTAIRVFDECESPYIDVKGDGVFALVNSDQAHRALASAVTFKTFVKEIFQPEVKRVVGLQLGLHLGIDRKTVLVRKLGLKQVQGRTDRQNEVWAGKPVNMAAKLASLSADGELLVSERFHTQLTNKKATWSCGCPDGTKTALWKAVDVRNDARFDFETAFKLESVWCATHGSEYCDALLSAD